MLSRFRLHQIVSASRAATAYVLVLAAASAVIAFGAQHVLIGMVSHLNATEEAPPRRPIVVQRAPVLLVPDAAGYLLPTNDWLEGVESPSFWKAVRSGSSWLFGTFEQTKKVSRAYRTMCVRLCDGYYWPVSYATTQDRFNRDAKTCQNSCAAPAQLFVYANPGGQPGDMKDLKGAPYSELPTASLFKTSYNVNCTCKPQPWQQASKTRHLMYALAEQKQRTRQRSEQRRIARELRSVTKLVSVQESQFKQEAKQVYRVAVAKASEKPVGLAGFQTSKAMTTTQQSVPAVASRPASLPTPMGLGVHVDGPRTKIRTGRSRNRKPTNRRQFVFTTSNE